MHMSHSCGVCFLAFALCLVASWSASAEVKAAPNTLQEATTALNAAKQSAEEVFGKTQGEVNKAKLVLARLETFATEAKNTEGMAAEAESKVEKEAKDNKDAKDTVNNIKSIFLKVSTFLTTAKKNLNTADTSLTTALQRATTLKTESNIEIPDTETTEGQYSAIAYTASGLRLQAEAVDKDIIAAIKIINKETATADTMEESVKEAKVANLHLSVIVAVAKIQTMMHEADSIFRNTQNKKNEVDKIVQEMQTLKTRATTEKIGDVNNLWKTAEDELAKATEAVDKANREKEAMKQQRVIADTALTNVQTAKKVDKAKEEVTKAEACVASVGKIVSQLQSAQKTAEDSLITVKASKQQMETALSLTTNSEPGTEQSLTTPQVKTLQDSVSAAVTKIRTMLEEADRTLQEAEKHKKAVHDIVEEMQTLKTTAKVESNDINELCRTAEGELTKATNAVAKVTIEKEAMSQQKKLAEVALTEVNKATEIEKTQPHVATATSCLDKVKGNLAQLRSALQTAKTSVTKTNDLKQKLKRDLSSTTTALTPEEVKQTENFGPSAGDGTQPDRKDTTLQPTSKDSLSQNDNSTVKLKDALSKGAQTVPTTALTGGKAPAPGAKNDSAMTVSVPLLVALIASAVLQ